MTFSKDVADSTSAHPIERRVVDDARSRVVGTFPFAVDRVVPGAAHMCAVRSTIPHGKILQIDTDAVKNMSGILAIVTGEDVRAELGNAMFHGENHQDQPLLAVDRVRYAGEPVALVIAENRDLAQSAARQIYVDYEELEYVMDHETAANEGVIQIHDAHPRNECGEFQLIHGDAEQALATAAFVDTRTYHTPTVNHAALEPYVATARWTADATLEVWTGTQAPYEVRKRLAGIFQMAQEDIRIRADNIGGGFGGKLDLRLEGMTAFCARRIGRPVRMELYRDEVFATGARHAATVTITTGADEEGRLVARKIDIVYNGGAYALSTPRSIRSGMIRSPGPYNIPNVYVRARGRYTNRVPAGPFRGAMTGQVCWAHESALDELANKIGIDPLEIRRKNLLRDGDTYATGEVMHEMVFPQLLEDVAAGLGWSDPKVDPGDDRVRGRGVAAVLKSTRTPSRSEAKVILGNDGRLRIRTSSIEMGQGAHWTLTEMVSAQFNVAPSSVAVTVVDTQHTPFDTVTSSSRTTLSMGLAVEGASRDLRAKIEQKAVAIGGPSYTFKHADGVVINEAGNNINYVQIAEQFGELVGEGEFESPPGYGVLDPVTSQGLHTVSWHQGVVGVEVEVDRRTGKVSVIKAHGASFAGRVIDRERVRKQTEGGMIFGMGQALMEEVIFDSGELSNSNFSEYQLPSILDAPVTISSSIISDPDPESWPHGVGENSVPPIPPAIANAVFDAVGARVRDLPITAERVLRAIRDQDGTGETDA